MQVIKQQLCMPKEAILDADPAFEERAGMFGKDFKRDMRPAQEIIDEAVNASKDADVIVAALAKVQK